MVNLYSKLAWMSSANNYNREYKGNNNLEHVKKRKTTTFISQKWEITYYMLVLTLNMIVVKLCYSLVHVWVLPQVSVLFCSYIVWVTPSCPHYTGVPGTALSLYLQWQMQSWKKLICAGGWGIAHTGKLFPRHDIFPECRRVWYLIRLISQDR